MSRSLRVLHARQALATACESLSLVAPSLGVSLPAAADLSDQATARRADLLASLIREASAKPEATKAPVLRFPGVPEDGLRLVSAGSAAEIAAELFGDLEGPEPEPNN